MIVCHKNDSDMIIISKSGMLENLAGEEEQVFVEEDDSAVLRRLDKEAEEYDIELNGGRRLECWIVVAEAVTLWMIQTVGVPEKVREKMDVLAVTVEDWISKTVLVRLPFGTACFPPLDRTPIAFESDRTVHLVIAGYSAMAEAFAVNAALVAHYPNYCRDTNLRTRITVIDNGLLDKSQAFIQRYDHLFENSYYRTLNLTDAQPQCVLHRPIYEGKRKDFVDVEWEFVDGDIRDDAVRQKLREWSCTQMQQLTIVLCNEDHSGNMDEALSLPDEVYLHGIPVLCHADNPFLLEYAHVDRRYSNVLSFGRDICSLDTLRMLKKLAKRVNYAYCHAFALEANEAASAPVVIDEELLEVQWNEMKSLPKVYSNVFNAMTLGTKMHSMGHAADEWVHYYALSKEEIEMLMEVEHNRWNVEELILGYRPVTDEEQELIELDIEKDRTECKDLKKKFRNDKIHYDLRSYDDLRKDATGRNVNVYDYVLTQSIPLIIKTCIAR